MPRFASFLNNPDWNSLIILPRWIIEVDSFLTLPTHCHVGFKTLIFMKYYNFITIKFANFYRFKAKKKLKDFFSIVFYLVSKF